MPQQLGYLISFFQQKESRILENVCSRSGAGKLQISLELLVPDNKKVPQWKPHVMGCVNMTGASEELPINKAGQCEQQSNKLALDSESEACKYHESTLI